MSEREDTGSDQSRDRGGSKIWLDDRDILKVESEKPAIRLDVSFERKKRLKESSRTIAVIFL